jgi:hypothetical protein
MNKKRKIINYREIGNQVAPVNMSAKEYTNFLCFKFGIRTSNGWDGIEKRLHRPNYSPEETFNIENRDDALEFLGIIKTPESPDGLEKRKKAERRKKQKDIRKNKDERRMRYQRKIDKKNEVKYTIQFMLTVAIWLAIYIILWGIAK